MSNKKSWAKHWLRGCAIAASRWCSAFPACIRSSCIAGLPDSGIRHVTARHEQGAAFMADGYARVTGKPGVAFVITGPGLTNALTAMGQAAADSVPMLVISGVNRRDTSGQGLGPSA